MSKLWLNSEGKVITDSQGRPILCDECPCEVEDLIMTCASCPDGTHQYWNVTIAGATGGWTNINGTHLVPYLGGCSWDNNNIGYAFGNPANVVGVGFSNTILAIYITNPFVTTWATYTPVAWDCLVGTTWNRTTDFSGGALPATVTTTFP